MCLPGMPEPQVIGYSIILYSFIFSSTEHLSSACWCLFLGAKIVLMVRYSSYLDKLGVHMVRHLCSDKSSNKGENPKEEISEVGGESF